MSCCGSNTLVIGRPTQQKYDNLCGNSGVTASTNGCGTPSCSSYTGPVDKKIGPRKNREKVREQIKDYVLLKLGAPVIKIELDSQQLDLCVDQAMMIFEDYAGREYFDYYTFLSIPGKSVYKLPDDVGVVRNVFYKEAANFAFQSSDLDGAIPLEYFYPGGAYSSMQGGMSPVQPIWGRMGEWVLYKQYEQMFSSISSDIGGWEWVSDQGYIKLYPVPCRSTKVMVHYMQQCKDFRQVKQAMQEGAYAEALIMIGNIRGKYQSPPGPGGGMAMDGDYMRNKGYELKEKWQEELIFRYGDLPGITLH